MLTFLSSSFVIFIGFSSFFYFYQFFFEFGSLKSQTQRPTSSLPCITPCFKPIKASYHTAKFGGHNHFNSRFIMILVGHVILVGAPHGKSTPFKFGDQRHCGSGDTFLVV